MTDPRVNGARASRAATSSAEVDTGGRRYGDFELLRRLVRQARPAWGRILLLFFVALLSSPLALLAPLPLKLAVDSVIGTRPLPGFIATVVPDALESSPAALLGLVAVLALAIALLTQLQYLAGQYLSTSTGQGLVRDFRASVFEHLQRLSLSYHDVVGTSDSVYRLQTDAPAIQKIVIDGFITTVGAAATLVGMVFIMFRLDWQLALLALAVSPPWFLTAHSYRPRLRRQSRRVKALESSAIGVAHEVLGALRVVKAFGQEERETDRFLTRSNEGVRGRIDLVMAEGRFSLALGLLMAGGTAAVLFVGILHVQAGALSLGNLLLLMGYVDQLYKPMKTISRRVATLQGNLASAERAFTVLDELPGLAESPDARPIDRARGAVAFRDVSFSYNEERPALREVTFEIEPGTQVGIVGTTGAGKTTLVSLLTRLYDPDEGSVLLDGVDLRDYRLEDLRRQFAFVLQETTLFSASIGENIAYAAPGASREQIVRAARAAEAHDFIAALPNGYETPVGERGIMLSGGQRQRIALARAFLKDSPVLILDEPTSAVDRDTEATIVEAIERLKRGRTVVVVSHRPGALSGCSTVLTLEEGRLVDAADRGSLPTGHRSFSLGAFPSVKRGENILAHPAVRAWRRLDPGHAVPASITAAKAKAKRSRRPVTVFRLEGVGDDGTAVIAKRCVRHEGLKEATVYERILPSVSLSSPRLYGTVEEPDPDPAHDVCWLFIGEIRGDKYDVTRQDHRVAAGRWLGILHTEAAASDVPLPDFGPSQYREQMRAASRVIVEGGDNPALGRDDVAFLSELLTGLDELDGAWDWFEQQCSGLPATLIHGDFGAKNLLVCPSPTGPEIAAYDWEDCGRAVPAIDLTQIATSLKHFSANPDLGAYLAVVRDRWPNCDRRDVERLAACGTVMRAIAVIGWDATNLQHAWANNFIPTFRGYKAELDAALDLLGLRSGRPRTSSTVETPA